MGGHQASNQLWCNNRHYLTGNKIPKKILKIQEIASTTNKNKILVDDRLTRYSSRAAKVFHPP